MSPKLRQRIGTASLLAVAVLPAFLDGAWASTSSSPNACVQDTPSSGWCGDGGRATAARLSSPGSIVALANGGYAIHDTLNSAIRVVGRDGIIRTLARFPCLTGQISPASDDRLLVSAHACRQVYAVSPSGVKTAVAGIGTRGYRAGDENRPARTAGLNNPVGVAVTPDGTIYIADQNHQRRSALRVVTPAGRLRTIPLPSALFVAGLAATSDGGVLVTTYGGSVWHIDHEHKAQVVAGQTDSGSGSDGDGGPATSAQLRASTGIAAMPDGGFVFTDWADHRVRTVAADGTIRTVAGTGGEGFAGDGGPAIQARLSNPGGVAVRRDGGLLIGDAGNHRVRAVSPEGTITTVAGSGGPGLATPFTDVIAECMGGCDPPDYIPGFNYFFITQLPLHARPKRRITVHFVTTRAVRVTATASRRGRVVRRARRRVRAGRRTVRLRGLPRGRYSVRLRGKPRGVRARTAKTTLRVK